MTYENCTLGSLLSAPEISRIAKDAIRNRDLSQEDLWNKTLKQLREEHIFSGNISQGIDRLYKAARTGDWYYSLYSGEECEEDKARKGISLVWFPSDDPKANERPFILLVPGGGFVNVWNLTEGWPIASEFNSYGYHAFILTYQVTGESKLLEKDLEDFERALRLIRKEAQHFHVRPDHYITCGFSAGGYLISLWNTEKGYLSFGLPKPRASFPVYPFISLKLDVSGDTPEMDTDEDRREDIRLYGCSVWEAMNTAYEIPEHAEGFPPCAFFLAAGDELVSPEHSRMLAGKLEELHIPCRLEIGPDGGHGFADGTGMCMAGWTKRAVDWYENASGLCL